MYHQPSYHWQAAYETGRGTQYTVDDTAIEECPVSFLSPESVEIVASLELARTVREATDESPLPPVRVWPVQLVDAARLIRTESIKQDNARFDAEQSEH